MHITHLNFGSIKCLFKWKMVKGIKVENSTDKFPICKTCIQAKQHIEPFPSESETKYTYIGEMTFSDLQGPAQTKGICGKRYYISFTDRKMQRTMIYFLKGKTNAEVLQKVKQYQAYIKNQTGNDLKFFRIDNGKEYLSQGLKEYLKDCSIQLQLTATYSPSQNRVVEELNQTIVEHACMMLIKHKLPLFLWLEAVVYATYLKN